MAMIEDQVKQTRCTTCDADHEYKQAKVPAQRRKKEAPSGLPAEALGVAARKRPTVETADLIDPADAIHLPDSATSESPASAPAPANPDEVPLVAAEAPGAGEAGIGDAAAAEAPPEEDDEGPVHRRLIRATLPRPEGQPPERKLPEFTMHQREVNGNRAGRAHRRGPRHGQMRGPQGSGQPARFGGPRHGPGHVPRHGSGEGGGQGPHGHGNRPGPGQPGSRHNRHGRKRGR
ncbi:MAG: hypothetical protein ACRD26_04870 [Vicinamibacterales bacterium]